MKVAFVYPGQGAQYVGMGKELAKNYAAARAVFEKAEVVLGFPISRYCFEGPEEELVQNDILQPAIFTVSMAVHAALTSEGVEPEAVAGLSVGEYAALTAAGVLSLEDALRLVRRRGQIMREALPPGTGGMLTVIGLSRAEVVRMCEEVGDVEPANFNCPGQIVVGGRQEALERLAELARERGARKVVRVAMSSPSHCSLLREAADLLALELTKVEFNDAKIWVFSNADAVPRKDREGIRTNLIRQLYSPVLWEDTMRGMSTLGITHVVEVGPGHTLLGLIRKTLPGIWAANVEDCKSLWATLAALWGPKGEEVRACSA